MREDLLGYLLSALEPHEMRAIEDELRQSPDLREELEMLRDAMHPLDDAMEQLPVVQSPPDLVARVMASLPPRDDHDHGHECLMTPKNELNRSPIRNRWADILIGAMAIAALLAWVIPAVARGRQEARRIACQNNLRQLGIAFSQFMMQNQLAALPDIATSGRESFAGMYAVRLADHELMPSASLRWCPEIANDLRFAMSLVRSEDLRDADQRGDIDRLREIQRIAGGTYSYNLGVVDGDHYTAPRYEGRATFAVLGDSPIAGAEFADGIDVSKLRWAHGDAHANLLYEDGSVRFVDLRSAATLPDHPFFNHRGSSEAGVNIDDASLAPSWRSPFISVRQR